MKRTFYIIIITMFSSRLNCFEQKLVQKQTHNSFLDVSLVHEEEICGKPIVAQEDQHQGIIDQDFNHLFDEYDQSISVTMESKSSPIIEFLTRAFGAVFVRYITIRNTIYSYCNNCKKILTSLYSKKS